MVLCWAETQEKADLQSSDSCWALPWVGRGQSARFWAGRGALCLQQLPPGKGRGVWKSRRKFSLEPELAHSWDMAWAAQRLLRVFRVKPTRVSSADFYYFPSIFNYFYFRSGGVPSILGPFSILSLWGAAPRLCVPLLFMECFKLWADVLKLWIIPVLRQDCRRCGAASCRLTLLYCVWFSHVRIKFLFPDAGSVRLHQVPIGLCKKTQMNFVTSVKSF